MNTKYEEKEGLPMKKNYTILLDSINSVKDFAEMIARFDSEITLASGRYIVNAKSIMGIFSLELNGPLKLTIYGEKEIDKLDEAIKPFLYHEKTNDN